MRHHVLLQFKDGYMNDEVWQAFRDTYSRIRQEVDGVRSVSLERGDRQHTPECMDISIRLELADLPALERYLASPQHQTHVERHSPYVTAAASFSSGVDAVTEEIVQF